MKNLEKYMIITADTNDADYVTQKTKITVDKLELFKPLIEAIKNFKPYKGKSKDGYESKHSHNFPYGSGEYIPRRDLGEKTIIELYKEFASPKSKVDGSDDRWIYYEFSKDCILGDFAENYCPYGEYGIHSIKSIEVVTGMTEKLL